MSDPTTRFTDRVDDYARYRPAYPEALGLLLREQCGAVPGATVADLGSGTGRLTTLLLDLGCRVFGVEPNTAMREAAERELGGRPAFASVAGRAEATGLGPSSVDLVTAAQAFHWFDPSRTRTEVLRILKPAGRVALIWNDRDTGDEFAREYEAFLRRYSVDYQKVNRSGRTDDEAVAAFLGPFQRAVFPNPQPPADLEALLGRYRSASYALTSGHPGYDEAARALADLYARHAGPEGVRFRLTTVVVWGRLRAP